MARCERADQPPPPPDVVLHLTGREASALLDAMSRHSWAGCDAVALYAIAVALKEGGVK